MIKFIKNTGDYFSSNYFDEDFSAKVLSKTGYAADDVKEFNKRISPLKDKYYRFKQQFIEGRLRTKDKIYESHQFHTQVLNALGYDGDQPQYHQLFHLSEHEAIPVRNILYRGDQAHLMIMEMQALIKEDDTEPDGLFEQRYHVEEEMQANPPQKYHRTQWDRVFQVPQDVKISPVVINKAISELFLLEPHIRPKYILLLAGNVIYLFEQEKWFRGSYLEFDLEELFTEATANRTAHFYALFYFLIGKESLAPDSQMVLLDQLDEDSHKSAYEVTKDLKEGIIHAVEALANEALYYQKNILHEEYDETDDTFEQEIKDDCLTIIYRLLFIFYAESREDLDILPSNDAIYNRGYSLEMLRDLEQVPLYSDNSLNGYFFHESLSQLFSVLSSGYREKENGQNKSFKVRHIDSPLFNNARLRHLHKVKFRNKIWQDIICRLSLSRQQKGKSRGRISYANLGINQLGSVYESLLAYRGFYAEQDYIEVHKAGKPTEGTYLVPRMRRDDFDENEILKDKDEHDVITKKGAFVYRLSGRDRQKSASYYTPEVLTRCTVKYTLKPILEKLEKGEMKATELLELKLLEPAMGAAAFHNEMINQLADAYLSYRQKELQEAGRKEWKVEPDKYKEELQKIKAYIATHNTYGVDLNPTAIELGKLSLWLNVIHKDMETPFFSNRLAVGNAVVGAWLKVYPEKALIEEDEVIKDAKGKDKRVSAKKEWWNTAPRQLEFRPQQEYDKIKHGRKPDEIYHFLLPDKNMVPSAGIKMLKAEYETESKAVSKWRTDFCAPLGKTEIEQLKKICNKIDELLVEYYRFQRSINIQTANKQEIFGVPVTQKVAHLASYDEKERLADQRNRHNAPYFKLKMVMDYWCSLWFWDVRDAAELPNRTQYWNDIERILELDTDKALDGVIIKKGQQKLFDTTHQLSMALEPDTVGSGQFSVGSGQDAVGSEGMGSLFTEAVVEYTTRRDLFDNNQRLVMISQLANKYFFFHPQLEFLDVFWERGGFDLIAGNPPWISIDLDEKGILSEKLQEVLIRKIKSPEIKILLENEILEDENLKTIYKIESLLAENTKNFITSRANYPILYKQRNNLYKCVLDTTRHLLKPNGIAGLIHPEEIYMEVNSGEIRKYLYNNLIYHFHFRNELKLFYEVQNQQEFCISVFQKNKNIISFENLFNIFHPSTVGPSFIKTSSSDILTGIKIFNESSDKYEWNLTPSNDRVIFLDKKSLSEITDCDDKDQNPCGKLPNIFSNTLLVTIKQLYKIEKIGKKWAVNGKDGFNEVNAINNKQIRKTTKQPDINKYEMIYNGAHFFVANPCYQSPIQEFTKNTDYEIVSLSDIEIDYLPRTNFIPSENFKDFILIKENSEWINSYRLAFNKMLDPASERTIKPVIIPPKTSHINSAYSVCFSTNQELLTACSISSSIIFDYLVKVSGASNLTIDVINGIPISENQISKKIESNLFSRILRLNCLSSHYNSIWSEAFKSDFANIEWSKKDRRLSTYITLKDKWDINTALRNSYERRLALVELDILVCMMLGLKIESIISIYSSQFPLVQQYENDTWYDTTGNIVFTCSKGLVGVGLDRAEWNDIKGMKAGETYEHTITKSELYHGKVVTYHAPFDKCDRVEDYRGAWEWFSRQFAVGS